MCPIENQPEEIRATSKRVLRWANGALVQETDDWLAREEPLEIRVKGESIVITMRTPGHDEELALGPYLECANRYIGFTFNQQEPSLSWEGKDGRDAFLNDWQQSAGW